ncbi:MAG: peptide chain release factor 3 [Planctomycetota bacterium]|nr:peptide chain release factor 3 [Planctomycetota bacterium]
MSNRQEIARCRTFAIISHPDAGKTTLTEKLLLYGGAVNLAGSVTARKNQRATTSDWMELERKRGISISSTVLQFEYGGFRINLLDTPGHKDFSEDTYRVLTAVDAALMVIDAGKGIETQTRKLFEVCRKRGVPIFTFMNKLDRPSRDAISLMDELESVLGIHAYAMNWPLGNGPSFRGIYDRREKQVHLFEKAAHGSYRAPVATGGIDDPLIREKLDEESYTLFRDEIDMLDHAGAEFDPQAVLAGKTTPVFFGSAMNNFGVQLLLDNFLKLSPPPGPRQSDAGLITPETPAFSGFVFKIQANMDPRHRDRLIFLRVVSGTFRREMSAIHPRTGRSLRLSNAATLFGRERETVDEAHPGDVVGLVGGRDLGIGDTLTEDPAIIYREIPRFPPECFAYLHNPNTSQYKRFNQGVEQLLQEGVVQAFYISRAAQKILVLGAVGPLQFEIVQYRLQSEYGAESRLERTPWEAALWARPKGGSSKANGTGSGAVRDALDDATMPEGVALAIDLMNNRVLLFGNDWQQRYFRERNPEIELAATPFDAPQGAAL